MRKPELGSAISFSVKFQPGGCSFIKTETTAQVVSVTFPNFKEHLFCRTLRVSEKQMCYGFNRKMVLLKTLLTIYPKNDKPNIVIKVCSHSTN